MSTTFLVAVNPTIQPILGYDPEEALAEHRKLVAVAWMQIDDVRANPGVEAVIQALKHNLVVPKRAHPELNLLPNTLEDDNLSRAKLCAHIDKSMVLVLLITCLYDRRGDNRRGKL